MIMDKQIYRVQDRDGRGPFKPGFSVKWLDEKKDISGLPIGPEFSDTLKTLDRKTLHYGYGCKSVDQLLKWFSLTELAKLRAHGYKVVRLRADVVIKESGTQVFFGRKKHLAAHAKVIEI